MYVCMYVVDLLDRSFDDSPKKSKDEDASSLAAPGGKDSCFLHFSLSVVRSLEWVPFQNTQDCCCDFRYSVLFVYPIFLNLST